MEKWAAIEGETPIDPSRLRNKSITTRRQLNEAESDNILKAHVKYLASRPGKRLAAFDVSWMCRLHAEMFGDVWEWGGEVRRKDVNFGVAFHQIFPELQDLENLLAYWEKAGNMPLAEQAVRLHHKAAWIHPFYNGNGRWARMLANVWLRQHGPQVIVWPEKATGTVSPIREKYLMAIKAADNGDYSLLLDMHSQYAIGST